MTSVLDQAESIARQQAPEQIVLDHVRSAGPECCRRTVEDCRSVKVVIVACRIQDSVRLICAPPEVARYCSGERVVRPADRGCIHACAVQARSVEQNQP